jgi:hypothetical protein
VIAVELAFTGEVLWEIRFFESKDVRRQHEHLPDLRLRLGHALVQGATVFGSLWAIADEGAEMGGARRHSWARCLATNDNKSDRGGDTHDTEVLHENGSFGCLEVRPAARLWSVDVLAARPAKRQRGRGRRYKRFLARTAVP